MKVKAYQSYFGGKESPGTYQTLINLIPPHKVYCSLFLGNDAVYRHIKPAEYCRLVDMDVSVIEAWMQSGFDCETAYNWLSCGDAFNVLRLFSEPEYFEDLYNYPRSFGFIFLDPPYQFETRKSSRPVYRHEMGDKAKHVELLELITAPGMAEYMIMICCYPNELYDLYLCGWQYKDYYSTIRGGLALERVYYNYPTPTVLHDTRYFGGNFRQREQFKRIVNSLVKKVKQVPEGLRPQIVADAIEALKQCSNEKI